MKLSVQLYSVREAAKVDFQGVLAAIADMGYDGVELAGLHGHAPVEVRKVLDRLRLVAPSAHCPVFDATRWDDVQASADLIGYRQLIGNSKAEDFADEAAVRAFADRINRAVEHFAPRGYTVGYHNHWWEFGAERVNEAAAGLGERANGAVDAGRECVNEKAAVAGERVNDDRTHADVLFTLCPQVAPQFDVYWVKVGGADPVTYLRRYAGRSKLVHLKDGPLDREQPMTALGGGKVDVRAVVGAAIESGIEWGVVELDRCGTDMLQAIEQSLRYVRPLVAH